MFCEGGHAIAQGSYLLSSEKSLSVEVQKLTGINDEMLGFAPSWIEAPEITALFEKVPSSLLMQISIVVLLNMHFSMNTKSQLQKPVDPYVFVKDIDKYKKEKLVDSAKRWGILNGAHRALADVGNGCTT